MDDDVVLVASRQGEAGPSNRNNNAPAARAGGVKRRATGTPNSGRGARRGPPQANNATQSIDLTLDDDVQITNFKPQAAQPGKCPQPPPLIMPGPPAAPAQPSSPRGFKCVICMDKKLDDMATTTCGHMFCHPCISEWVQKKGNCPQCRQKLTKTKVIRIYPSID